MEIAKFVFTAIGTFLSVSALSFTVFQYWKKKQDEKFARMQANIDKSVTRLGERLEYLEKTVFHNLENRLALIEGELKGLKSLMQPITNWFINNNTGGSK